MRTTTARLWNWLALGLLALGPLIVPATARAEDDPPGRAGRIAEMQGDVSTYDEEQGQWAPAVRNRPLTGGDRIATEDNGRVEIRVGSTTLRLGPGSELEVLRLDDERLRFQLHSGSLALRVRAREVADEIDVVTDEARLRPQRSGHYRIDRRDDSTFAAALRGTLRVDDRDEPFSIESGRRAEIWREGGDRRLQHSWSSIPDDEFGDWVAREDRKDDRSVSRRYVSPEMTGAEDLDRYGRWDQHPDYGPVWSPIVVTSGWAPYRQGRWVWVRPWGWSWVDEAPWGFAPFHYGRWVYWRDRWCWTPGSYVARPVYAPALVAWVGGVNFNVSVTVGGPMLPAVGWLPLAPLEIFFPYYRHSTVYVDRVNHRPPGRPAPPPPSEPIMYGNQGRPNAVTVVPRDVLVQRQPVGRAVIDLRDQTNRALPVVRGSAPVTPPPRAEAPAVVVQPGRPVRSVPIMRPGGPPPVLSIPREETPSRPAPPISRRDEGPGRLGAPAPRTEAPAPRADAPQRKGPEVVDLRQRQEREAAERAAQERANQERRGANDQRAAAERQAQERQAAERAQQERAQRELRRETPRETPREAPREVRPVPVQPAQPAPPVQPQVQPPAQPQPAPRQQRAPERDDRNEPRNEPRNTPRERDANVR